MTSQTTEIVKSLSQAKDIIRNLSVRSLNNNTLEAITSLRGAIDEFYKVFNFPHGTKQIMRKK